MTRFKLFLMRHSKSCSNHVRASAESYMESSPGIIMSKEIRDPGLSIHGTQAARAYGPTLRARLVTKGFDLDGAFIGASSLHRAQDTARIVFGRSPVALPHFTENGQIPENTATGRPYAAPNWRRFIAHLSTLVTDGQSVAVVGHGSFLRTLWPKLTGAHRKGRLNNLDGILLDADIGPRGLNVHSFQEIMAPISKDRADKCSIRDTRKIKAYSRRMTRQRGGGTNLPLAYVQDGAQMRGMSGDATGVGLAGTSGSWVRTPLNQTGGFSPSVMGAFASNGLRLVPIAGYMGYKMYSNQKKTRRRRRGRGTRRHR